MQRKASKPLDATVERLSVFLTPEGRLPGFAQRRIDELIERKREGRLSAKESRELREALQYIDEKSILLLEHPSRPLRSAR